MLMLMLMMAETDPAKHPPRAATAIRRSIPLSQNMFMPGTSATIIRTYRDAIIIIITTTTTTLHRRRSPMINIFLPRPSPLLLLLLLLLPLPRLPQRILNLPVLRRLAIFKRLTRSKHRGGTCRAVAVGGVAVVAAAAAVVAVFGEVKRAAAHAGGGGGDGADDGGDEVAAFTGDAVL